MQMIIIKKNIYNFKKKEKKVDFFIDIPSKNEFYI